MIDYKELLLKYIKLAGELSGHDSVYSEAEEAEIIGNESYLPEAWKALTDDEKRELRVLTRKTQIDRR
jgi:hypothetical protein